MPTRRAVRYVLTLHFQDEPRTSAYRPTSFAAAVQYALDFARKNRGVRVEVGLDVPTSPYYAEHCVLFDCLFPTVGPRMQKNLVNFFGTLPPDGELAPEP